MKGLTIINQDGILLIDSREVAEVTNKQHKDLLATIRGYIEHLLSGNFRPADFFIESTYTDSTNRELPCYLLTKKGCDMVANKMTGEKGVLFTATYVTKFEEMEQSLKTIQPNLLTPKEQLKLQLQILEEQDKKIDGVVKTVDDLQANMPLFNVECKELQALVRKIGTKALGGYRSPAYSDNSLRGRVYSDIQHQLKREFGIERYEAIKRCQLDTAIKIVEEYKAPTVLADEILLINTQISFDKEAM